MKKIELILRQIESVVKMVSNIGAIAVCILLLLILSDIIGRTAFNSPIRGTVEIGEYLLVLIAFLTLGYAQLQGRHVKIEILVSRLSLRSQAIIRIFVLFLSSILFTVMSWQLARETHKVWVEKASHWAVEFYLPTWPPNLFAFLGILFLVISLLTQIVRDIIGLITCRMTEDKT